MRPPSERTTAQLPNPWLSCPASCHGRPCLRSCVDSFYDEKPTQPHAASRHARVIVPTYSGWKPLPIAEGSEQSYCRGTGVARPSLLICMTLYGTICERHYEACRCQPGISNEHRSYRLSSGLMRVCRPAVFRRRYPLHFANRDPNMHERRQLDQTRTAADAAQCLRKSLPAAELHHIQRLAG